MPGQLPLVSYILVNWNTEELLPRALDSIAAQDFPLREVILVNNDSPGFSELDLSAYGLKVVQAGGNRGFAEGNNIGIRESRGDVVVLLNCDAALEPGFTRRAVEVLEARPRCGTVVPKILRDDMSGTLDSTGHLMREDRTPLNRGVGEPDNGLYDMPGPVFGGTAAAIAYRREMLEQLSLDGEVFCRDFFAYFEDVDLDWRAQLAGWEAWYEPACRAIHRGHGSGGRAGTRIQRIAEKNRYLMLIRNDTIASQLPMWIPLAIYETWHFLMTLLRPWVWPSLLSFLACLPRALHYRSWSRRHRRIPQSRVAAQFIPRGSMLPPTVAATSPLKGQSPGMEEERYPLVSILIINFNGLSLTRACLESALLQTYENCEIIVIDNGSEADEASLLAMDFPQLRIHRLEHNLGFSGGVNWAVSLSKGDYIALVNNDSVMDPDCIANLMYAQRRTGADAVSGRLVDITERNQVVPLLNALAIEQEDDVVWDLPQASMEALAESRRNHGLSIYGYIVRDSFAGQDSCFYPSGGLCLLKRSSVNEWLPQFFPQQYFAYQEDVWQGFALRHAGGRIAKAPAAAAVHLASSSTRSLGRPRLRFYQERNRIMNLLCWLPASVIWRMLPMYWLVGLLAGLRSLITKPADWLGEIAAHLWLATHPLQVLRQRQEWRSHGNADKEMLAMLSGQVRGRGGALNRLSLAWCRMVGINCLETSGKEN
ncbi:glycosyltransferase [bacterium]|nr:glycosyltransferase [bacterium]